MKYVLKALYTLVYTLAFPIILLRFLWRNITDKTGRRKAGPRRRFLERLGFSPRPSNPGGIVFHMVSVGEALGAINLVKDFQRKNPEVPITITCTTQQGSKIIQERLGDSVNHCYLPYDLPIFLLWFIRRIQPTTLVILETELWPNLMGVCFANQVRTILINARLSEKSYNGYTKLRPLVETMLQQLTHLCSQSPADAERFKKLGLPETKLSITGNLKFDIEVDETITRTGDQLKQERFANRSLWIAASTHPGEDEIVLQSHKILRETHADLLLIIAPRHIDRAENIRKLSESLALPCSVHSKTSAIKNECAVYLVDTMGELMKFYASADICLVGGSLVQHGGHNPIEPGVLHKPIIAGPYNHNFQTIYDQLTQCDGVIFTKDSQALTETVHGLLEDPQRCRELADNAFQYVNAHRGATLRSVERIEQVYRA
ncbi:3-deoxy-D-manno-octulosonic acid transferase [Thalassocella blandensis]|nr:3-deoxy-D-manno-octulosonic acid transferase [Thalassocella blandensis]